MWVLLSFIVSRFLYPLKQCLIPEWNYQLRTCEHIKIRTVPVAMHLKIEIFGTHLFQLKEAISMNM